jgi:hypothetical protein
MRDAESRARAAAANEAGSELRRPVECPDCLKRDRVQVSPRNPKIGHCDRCAATFYLDWLENHEAKHSEL